MSRSSKEELNPKGSSKRSGTRSAAKLAAEGDVKRGDTSDEPVDKGAPPKTPDPVRGDSTAEPVDKGAPPKTPDPVRGDSTSEPVDKGAPPKTPDPVRGD